MYDLEGLLAIYKCSLGIDIITVDTGLPVIDNVRMDIKSMSIKYSVQSIMWNMKSNERPDLKKWTWSLAIIWMYTNSQYESIARYS